MGSQGGIGSSTISGTQTQEPKTSSLARQGSIYSLTLDEVQHHLGDMGKPLSSMNLDELLKTVWTAEANQGIGSVDYGAHQHGQLPLTLNRQSSLTLSRDLSKKTVDEVWQDIQQGQNNHDRKAQERQITLGEITLEDFLVKAGVVAEPAPRMNSGSCLGVDAVALPQQNVPPQSQWIRYQIPSIHHSPPQQQHQQQQNILPVYMPGQQVPQPLTIGSNPMMDTAYNDTQMTMSPSTLMGTLSDTQTPGRKRVGSGDVIEKTVERRQKRMIKNRESAARSRARKQVMFQTFSNAVLFEFKIFVAIGQFYS